MTRSMLLRSTAIAALMTAAACKLDSTVFSSDTTIAYNVSNAVVPDSLRTEVTFASGGATLHGLWLRQPDSAPRLTLVFSHGKGGNLAQPEKWRHAEYLWMAGFDVLTYDYRGFGRSTGSSDDETTLIADAEAALAFVLTQPGVIPGDVISFGHSLGSAPAIALAVAHPELRALVVESGFSSGQAMAETANPLGMPVTWLLRQPMRNVQRLAQVQLPVLVIHGDADILIPVAQGRVLYAAARDPKQLMVVSGAGHEDVPVHLGVAAYRTLLRTFLNAPLP